MAEAQSSSTECATCERKNSLVSEKKCLFFFHICACQIVFKTEVYTVLGRYENIYQCLYKAESNRKPNRIKPSFSTALFGDYNMQKSIRLEILYDIVTWVNLCVENGTLITDIRKLSL